MAKQRNTDRKRFLQDALKDSEPVVLDELRWRVMRQELQQEQPPRDEMRKADTVSFNRSLRTFLPAIAPGLAIQKIARSWTAGLLARVAVFRLKRWGQIEQFLACETPSIHFWSNARTADVWEEIGDGNIDVLRPDLIPPGAPESLPSLYPYGSRWPRGGAERRPKLEQLGPKYVKHPIVCAKLCLRNVEAPQKGEELAIVRIQAGLPLTAIWPEGLSVVQFEMPEVQMYVRRRGVTRKVEQREIIV